MNRLVLAILALLVAGAIAYYYLGPPPDGQTPTTDVAPTETSQAETSQGGASQSEAQDGEGSDEGSGAPALDEEEPPREEKEELADPPGDEEGEALPEQERIAEAPVTQEDEGDARETPAVERDERASAVPEASEDATSDETAPDEASVSEEPAGLAPEVDEPEATAEESEEEGPQFDIVRVDRSGSVVAAGRARPGAVVELRRGAEVVDSVEADSRGEWLMIPPETLPEGDHELQLVAREADVEQVSDDVVIVSVPLRSSAGRETESDAGPAEETAGDAEPEEAEQPEALAVLLPSDPEDMPRILQGPQEGLETGDLSLETLRYDAEGWVTISGRVTPGGTVFVYIDDAFVDDVSGDDEGRWLSRPELQLSEGLHQLRLDQVDSEGKVLARLETPFVRSDLVADAGAGERFVVVQPGNSLWRIARRSYGQGTQYTLIFQANQEQIRDPDLIYPGQIFLLPQDG